MPPSLLPRGILHRFEALMDSVPVVILEGPRACGKTAVGTLLSDAGRIATVADLSDATVRTAATASPTAFVDDLPTPAFIDEAQLVPELTVAIKRRVDRDRQPGAFVLTGSSRIGRTQLGGSDPLAGRAARVGLWPMTQAEQAGKPVDLVSSLLTRSPATLTARAVDRTDLLGRIRRGGLPTLNGLVARVPEAVRPQLMAEYVEAVLYHEVGRRHDRAELVRLFRYLAASTGRLLNGATVASELGMTRETLASRLATLDGCFLVHSLAGHRPAEHRVLTAHPKVHAVDVGLAAWAANVGDGAPAAAVWGSLVETFVVNEIRAQAEFSSGDVSVRHWRDTAKKVEVDAVLIHRDGTSLAIEVKAGPDVRPGDLLGLRHYLSSAPAASRGVVFYTGRLTLQLDERIWAVPISALWT